MQESSLGRSISIIFPEPCSKWPKEGMIGLAFDPAATRALHRFGKVRLCFQSWLLCGCYFLAGQEDQAWHTPPWSYDIVVGICFATRICKMYIVSTVSAAAARPQSCCWLLWLGLAEMLRAIAWGWGWLGWAEFKQEKHRKISLHWWFQEMKRANESVSPSHRSVKN